MAETAARHVNTMEAHHAPNWSRKQHVDGAHDKPSATSGSQREYDHPHQYVDESEQSGHASSRRCVGFELCLCKFSVKNSPSTAEFGAHGRLTVAWVQAFTLSDCCIHEEQPRASGNR